MDYTAGSNAHTGITAHPRTGAAGRGHTDGDEDDPGDPVPLPPDHTRRQRGGLHEGHRPVRTRNRRPVRRAAGGDVAGSGAVHPLRPCATALPAPSNPLRQAAASAPLAAHHPGGHHRGAVLQGDHRQCAHCSTAARHVHHGTGTGGQVNRPRMAVEMKSKSIP